jgi:hypothetical protein
MRNIIALGVVGAVGIANANVVIDDFQASPYHKTIISGSVTEFQNGTMLGGDRATTTSVQSNLFGLEIQTDIDGGVYALSSQSNVNGSGQLGYGFASSNGGVVNQNLNANLSGENQFKLNFISSDAPGSYTIGVRSSSSAGGNFVNVTKAFQGNSVNTPFMSTVNFSEFGGVNFSDIDQITLTFDTGLSGDVAISSFQAVPEPATMAILGAAAAAFLRRRK